jgi:hypothetical protein
VGAIGSRAQAAAALCQAPAKPDGPSKQIFVLKKQDFIDRTGTGVGRERPAIANRYRKPVIEPLHAVPNAQLWGSESRVGRRDVFQGTGAPLSFSMPD